MPTRRISRALRRHGAGAKSPIASDAPSLIDLLNTIRLHDFSILPISYQAGHGILGRGLSGDIRQLGADAETMLAFKQGISSMRERDDDEHQDWNSLATELTVLGHPAIRANHRIIQLLGVAFSVDSSMGPDAKAWPFLITRRSELGNMESFLSNTEGGPDDKLRWELFVGVTEAMYLLHTCGRCTWSRIRPVPLVEVC